MTKIKIIRLDNYTCGLRFCDNLHVAFEWRGSQNKTIYVQIPTLSLKCLNVHLDNIFPYYYKLNIKHIRDK